MEDLKHNPRNRRAFRRFGRKVLKTILVLLVLISQVGPYTYIGAKTASAASTIPKLLNYQARITDDAGVPVPDGNLNIWISVYDAPSGGSCLYAMQGSCGTPDYKTVNVANGVFSMLIGDVSGGDNEIPDTLFSNPSLYLGVTVASDTEMVPRKRITSAPYAINADRLDGLDAASSGSTTPYIFAANANGNLVITGDPQGGSFSQGSLYVNPAGATGVETIFGVADNGSGIFRIRRDGEITHSGALRASAASSTAQFIFSGAVSQSNNIFEVKDGSANDVLTVSATGVFVGTDNWVPLSIGTNAPSNVASLHLHWADGNGNGLVITDAGSGTGNDNGGAMFFDSTANEMSVINYEANGYIAFYTNTGSNVERMRLSANGNLGIGNAAPAQRLTVGSATSTFEVDPSGNLVKINNVVYSWPASQGGSSTVLTNNGSGVLTWSAASTGGTLQTAYDSSTGTTEIFLGATRGALTLADSFSGFGGNLFEIQDRTNGAGDYGSRYFAVSATSTRIGVTSNGTTISGYNVGIGTATPGNKLHIAGSGSAFYPLRLESSSDLQIGIDITKSGRQWLLGIDGANNGGDDFFIYDNTATAFRMRFDSSGRVGVGATLTPAGFLNVESSLANTVPMLSVSGTTASTPSSFQWTPLTNERAAIFTGASGAGGYASVTIGTNQSEASGNTLGFLAFAQTQSGKTNPDGFSGIKASIGGFTEGSGGSAYGFGGYMAFSTRTNNSTMTERMRLTGIGHLGVGNFAPANLLTVGSATSTFEVNAAGNLIKVNNVPYNWPSSQGGSSTVLTNNGSGVLTWSAPTASTTLQEAYDNDANGGDATITTNSTDGDIIIAGDQDFRVTSTGLAVIGNNTHTTTDTLTLNGSALTTGRLLTLNGGNALTGAGAVMSATGTIVSSHTSDHGLFNIQANIAKSASFGGIRSGGVNLVLNDRTQNASGDAVGYNLQIISDSFTAHNQYGYIAEILANSGSPTDQTFEALILLDNKDTATGNLIAVTDGLRITNTGNVSGGLTNAITIGASAQPITTAINIASTGVTSDIRLQNGEVIHNDTDGTISFTDGTNVLCSIIDGGTTGTMSCTGGLGVTLQGAYDTDANGGDATITTNSTDGDIIIAGDQDFRVTTTGQYVLGNDTHTTTNVLTLNGAALTGGELLTLNGGLFNGGTPGMLISASGTVQTGYSSISGPGLFTLQANMTYAGSGFSVDSAGIAVNLNDAAQTGGSNTVGYDLNITSNGFAAHTQRGYSATLNANSGSPSDNTWEALYYAENLDTATGNQITVTSGFQAHAASGVTGMTNGFLVSTNVGSSNITNGFAITTAGATTVTNGINFSGATGLTTDFVMQNGETIDNDTNGTINVSANTLRVSGASGASDTLVVTNSGQTSADLLFLETGSAIDQDGTLINATGTKRVGSTSADTGLVNIQANMTYTGSGFNEDSSALAIKLNDIPGVSANSTTNGIDLAITSNSFASHTQRGIRAYITANSGSPTDATWENLILLDNADTATGNQISVTDALLITNSGNGAGMTNAITIGASAQPITTAINLASTGITTDIRLQNGEVIHNDTDGTIAFTDGTNVLCSIIDGGTTGSLSCTGGITASTSLNQAYLNSTSTTEIYLTPSQGALSIADTFSGTGSIFEILDRTNAAGNYSRRYFGVSATSTLIGLSSNGTALSGHNVGIGQANPTARLHITPDANDEALIVTGYSVTGSSSAPMFNFSGTWNTAGAPVGMLMNITDTASTGNSTLMTIQQSGTTRFNINKSGATTITLNNSLPITGTGGLGINNSDLSPNNFSSIFFGDGVGAGSIISNQFLSHGASSVSNIVFQTRDNSASLATRLTIGATTTAATNDFTVDGNVTLGNASSTDSVTFGSRIGSNLTPTTDAIYDLGDYNRRWRDLWLSGGSAKIALDQSGTSILTIGFESAQGLRGVVKTPDNIPLHLRSGNSGTGGIYITDSGATLAGNVTITGTCTGCGGSTTLQQAYDNDANGGNATITTNSTDGALVVAGDQDLLFTSTGDVNFDSNTFVVDSSTDRVGIGVAAPLSKLHISGGDIRVDVNTTIFANGTGALNVGDSSDTVNLANGTLYALSSTGNVGAGIAAPGARLSVADASVSPTNNIFEVGTLNMAQKIFTVSSTTTKVDGIGTYDLTINAVNDTGISISRGNSLKWRLRNDFATPAGVNDVFVLTENIGTARLSVHPTTGWVGTNTDAPSANLDVRAVSDTVSHNMLSVANASDSLRYLTVSSTSTNLTYGHAIASGNGALNLTVNGITSGMGIQVQSSATSFSGNLAYINLSGNNANNTGSLLHLNSSGSNSRAKLLEMNSASANSFGGTGAVRLNLTGNHSFTGFQIDDVTTNGTAMLINASAIQTGNGLMIDSTTATSMGVGSVLKVVGPSTCCSGANSNGIVADFRMSGNPTGNNSASMVWMGATGLTTGKVLTVNGSDVMTSGTLVQINTRAGTMTSGNLLSVNKTSSSAAAVTYTGNLAEVNYDQIFNGGGNNTGRTLSVARNLTINGAAANPTISGSVADISDSMTVTLGSVTHTANVLSLTQNYASASGAVLKISNSGAGFDILGSGSTWSVDKNGNATFASCTGCGGGATSLLQAYNASTSTDATPGEIYLNTTRGAFTISDAGSRDEGSGDNSGLGGAGYANLFEILDRTNAAGNYSRRYFWASATGVGITGGIQMFQGGPGSNEIAAEADFTLNPGGGTGSVQNTGSFLVDGSTTLGNASGDSLIMNGSTWTVNNALNMGLSTNKWSITSTSSVSNAIEVIGNSISSASLIAGTANGLTSGNVEWWTTSAGFSGNMVKLDATGAATGDFIELTSTSGFASARAINIDFDNANSNNVIFNLVTDETSVSGTAADTEKFAILASGSVRGDGNLTFGSASGTNTVDFTGARIASNLTPTTDNTYSLGDYNRRWKDLWLSGGSAHIAYDTSGTTSVRIGWNDVGGRRAQIMSSGQPIQISPSNTIGSGLNVDASGNVSFSTSGALSLGSSTSTGQLHIAGSIPTSQSGSVSTLASPVDVYVQDNYAYVVGGTDTTGAYIQVIDVSNPASPTVIGTLNGLGTIPTSVVVSGNYAYIGGTTTSHQLKIVDVSIPSSMKLLGTYGVGASGGINAMVVSGRYVYFYNDADSNVTAVDVSDPTSPTVTQTASYAAAGSAAVAMSQGWLHVGGTTNGIRSYSADHNALSSPAAGSTSTGVSCPSDMVAQGGYLYVVDASNLNIYDVRNPKSLSRIGTTAIGGVGCFQGKKLAVHGNRAYVTNFSTGGATNFVHVIDVSTPSAPTLIGNITPGTLPKGVDVAGRHLVVINTTSATLQTFDVGGSYIQQLDAGGVRTSNLLVRSLLEADRALINGGATIANTLNVTGNIVVNSATSSTTAQSLLTLTAKRQTGGTFSSSMLYVNMSGVDANSFTGNGILIDADSTAVSGAAKAILVRRSFTNYFDVSSTGTTSIRGELHLTEPSGGTIRFPSDVDGQLYQIQIGRNNVSQGTCASAQNEGIRFVLRNGTQVGRLACVSNNTTALNMYASAFNAASTDLAEMYSTDPSDGLVAGDVVRLDESSGDLLVRRTTGAYGDDVVGIISDAPGITMTGVKEDGSGADTVNGRFVAMAGRVPTKVSDENGAIAVGDYLVPSSVPGVAMRMTKPGVAIGRALDAWTGAGQGTIRVFVQVGWHSGLAITTDGAKSLFNDDFAFDAVATATASNTPFSSRALTFRGSAWDSGSSTAVARNLSILNEVSGASTYQMAFRNHDGNLLASLNQAGDLGIAGSLTVEGGFDYAEMFPAVPDIEAGDIVMIDPDDTNGYGVKKTQTAYENSAIGVISTKPGFLTGKKEDGAQPVALAGRVPVKISMENGEIKPGDPITSSSTPGVGMKAVEAGRVIGLALQGAAEDGTVLIFVNPSWWNGPMPVGGTLAEGTLSITQDSLLDFKNSVLTNVAAIISTNGSWSVTSDGQLAAMKVEAKDIVAETFTVKAAAETPERTVGVGRIQAGYDAVLVPNAKVKPDSLIIVTFEGNPGANWWIDEKLDGHFVLKMAQGAHMDLKFTYWIVPIDGALDPTADEDGSASGTPETPPEEEAPEPEAPPEDGGETGSGSGTEETP